MNKTIYQTYKNKPPKYVFQRWKYFNRLFTIEFSDDTDCIHFLQQNFNTNVANLFKNIKDGRFKADLWRLCKLYKHGGVYADIDLVPYINMDHELDDKISFYSIMSKLKTEIFQAFMVTNKPKQSLILCFIISFLLHKPYQLGKYINGPCIDMYNCLSYNILSKPQPNTLYSLTDIKIPIYIGSCSKNIKSIDLIYFPNDVKYTIKFKVLKHESIFDITIMDNKLIVKKKDGISGWDESPSVDIIFKTQETVYLLEEKNIGNGHHDNYVFKNNKIIMASRDVNYDNFVDGFKNKHKNYCKTLGKMW